MNTLNKKTTIYAEVLLSSGTTQLTTDHKIEDVKEWWSHESGYYEIRTESGTYCFPIARTILKVIK